jgi:hypothetical protein
VDQEPKLRAIPAAGATTRSGSARGGSEPNRVQLALGVALAIALVLLLWSYFSLGSRIDALEGETRTLRQAVAERDDLISAQRSRLYEVRGRLQEVIQLLDAPVQSASPPVENPPATEHD